jgi:PIN domain nuclease of toxin-antitoxin system
LVRVAVDRVAVLDATAFMALLRGEPGADTVAACLPWAVVSAVNQAEVQAALVAAGMDEQTAWWHIAEIKCESVPFDEEQARIAGGLARIGRPLGLSLGDRCCLALAFQRQATVYTTNPAWKNLADMGVDLEVVVIA